jgi:predicted hydrocarbon binding protein
MDRTEETTGPDLASPGAAETSAGRGVGVTPQFPLLLLQTMRDMDRPAEVFEAEDLTVSLPRRLGLSDVVGRQIHRFQEEVRRRRQQSPAEVIDLMKLVVRRPDAEAIFREAGRRIALQAWNERAAAMRGALRWMPRPAARLAALRAAKRLFRRLLGDGKLRLRRKPLEMLITYSLTARADPTGRACAFYSGALEELLQRYTNRGYRVLHEQCAAHGADVCEWTVRVS